MKYMLMFWVDESAEVTEDDDAAMMIAVASWVEKMTERGILLEGSPLSPVRDGKIVSVRNGELLVSDGPFAETKEQIGGFWVIKAPDLDAALELAAKGSEACGWPVEVRPFQDEAPDA